MEWSPGSGDCSGKLEVVVSFPLDVPVMTPCSSLPVCPHPAWTDLFPPSPLAGLTFLG